jgi:hypothetical protein
MAGPASIADSHPRRGPSPRRGADCDQGADDAAAALGELPHQPRDVGHAGGADRQRPRVSSG